MSDGVPVVAAIDVGAEGEGPHRLGRAAIGNIKQKDTLFGGIGQVQGVPVDGQVPEGVRALFYGEITLRHGHRRQRIE